MIQIDELKRDLKELSGKLGGIAESLDVESLKGELEQLNSQMHAEGFWNDVQKAQGVAQRAKNIEYKLEELEKLTSALSSCEELLEMCGDDEAMLEETAAKGAEEGKTDKEIKREIKRLKNERKEEKRAATKAAFAKLRADQKALTARRKQFCAEWIAAAKAEGKKKWLHVLAREAFSRQLAAEADVADSDGTTGGDSDNAENQDKSA